MKKKTTTKGRSNGENHAHTVPEMFAQSCGTSEDVLAMTDIDQTIEMEAFSSNVDEQVWATEIETIHNDKEDDVSMDSQTVSADSEPAERSTTSDKENEIITQEADIVGADRILALLKTTNRLLHSGSKRSDVRRRSGK